jgi:hypothetical protein
MSAFRNVWWAIANEFDMLNKTDKEWEVYCKTVTTYDPSNHLVSMHNGKRWYNHSMPWITHVSVQSPYLQDIQEWRLLYNKPVINDEPVYEGNVPADWGNLTPEELVNRFWICWTRGAYCTHGETYEHPENILWWSKGGQLYGKSPQRIAFLHQVMEESPSEGLLPFHNVWNKQTYLYKTNEFYLHYFGNNQQAAAVINLPEDIAFQIDVIDTWEMTITRIDGTFKGETRIPILQKPYMAVRAVAVE